MCIAIVKPRGVSLAEDRLRLCFENNPDGAGFAIAKGGQVEIHKGFTTFEAFWRAYRKHCVDAHPALVHFRITTRGSSDPGNHHPFQLDAGALVHNGTINWLGKAGTGKSDTRLFAELLKDLTLDQLTRLRPLVEHGTGWSRFAVLGHGGQFLVFNPEEWEQADGALYSNDSYLPEPIGAFASSFQGRDRYTAPFWWDSDLTLYREAPDGTVYRDEALERDILQEWVACYGAPPTADWAWEVLDELTYDYLEDESHELEHLHAA